MINSTYVIIPVEEITNDMVEESVNESATIKYNEGKTKAVLKYNSSFPNSTKGYKKYSHLEIIEELKKPEWLEEVS